MSAFVPTSMPRVGSFRMITFGAISSHFARITFCWLPPDSVPAKASPLRVLIASLSIHFFTVSRSRA